MKIHPYKILKLSYLLKLMSEENEDLDKETIHFFCIIIHLKKGVVERVPHVQCKHQQQGTWEPRSQH